MRSKLRDRLHRARLDRRKNTPNPMAVGEDPDAPDWFEPAPGIDGPTFGAALSPGSVGYTRSEESDVVNADDLSFDEEARGGTSTADAEQDALEVEGFDNLETSEPDFAGPVPGFSDWREELRERLKRIRARRAQEQLAAESDSAAESAPVDPAATEAIGDVVAEIDLEGGEAPLTVIDDGIGRVAYPAGGDRDAELTGGPAALALDGAAADRDAIEGEAEESPMLTAVEAEPPATPNATAGQPQAADPDTGADAATAGDFLESLVDDRPRGGRRLGWSGHEELAVDGSEAEPEIDFDFDRLTAERESGPGDATMIEGLKARDEGVEARNEGVEALEDLRLTADEDETMVVDSSGPAATENLETTPLLAEEGILEVFADEPAGDSPAGGSLDGSSPEGDELDAPALEADERDTEARQDEEIDRQPLEDEQLGRQPLEDEELGGEPLEDLDLEAEDAEADGDLEDFDRAARPIPEPVSPELDFEPFGAAVAGPAIDVEPAGEEDEGEAIVWDPDDAIEAPQPTIASSAGPLGERAAAAVCDGLVLTGIAIALVGAASSGTGLPFRQILAEQGIWIAVTWSIFAAGYSVFFVGSCGQTIGRMVMRLRVVGSGHFKVGFDHAAIRLAAWLLSLLPLGAGMLPALKDPQRRALHDRLSQTRVVKA